MMNYFVYADGLLGLATEERSFDWSYGTHAPSADRAAFDACRVRIHLSVVPDRAVFDPTVKREDFCSFGSFFTRADQTTLYYEKHLFAGVSLRFALLIENETEVHLTVGKTYLNAVRMRVMNLHALRYVLFDLASALLLRQGFLTLYASAVFFPKQQRSVLCFGSPGSGKTLAALRLCRENDADYISEDLVFTDGTTLYGVPHTASYRPETARKAKQVGTLVSEVRRNTKKRDKEAFGIERVAQSAPATDLFLLQKGTENGADPDCYGRICALNRYLLHYHRSPVLLALAYRDPSFSPTLLEEREEHILQTLLEHTSSSVLTETDPALFPQRILQALAEDPTV